MIDSPVLAGWRAHSVRMAKATRLIGKVSPARVSKFRRQRWESIDAVRQHYGAKHMFARWDPRAFEDYLAAGIEPDEAGGVRLGLPTRGRDPHLQHLAASLRRLVAQAPSALPGGLHRGHAVCPRSARSGWRPHAASPAAASSGSRPRPVSDGTPRRDCRAGAGADRAGRCRLRLRASAWLAWSMGLHPRDCRGSPSARRAESGCPGGRSLTSVQRRAQPPAESRLPLECRLPPRPDHEPVLP